MLNAARIGARSITADKLATNAIQVRLANGRARLGSRRLRSPGTAARRWKGDYQCGDAVLVQDSLHGRNGAPSKKDAADVQGIVNQLAYRGDYVAWTYQTTSTGDYYTCLTLDPKGRFYRRAGIHLGADLRMNGYKVFTSDTRYISFVDTNYR